MDLGRPGAGDAPLHTVPAAGVGDGAGMGGLKRVKRLKGVIGWGQAVVQVLPAMKVDAVRVTVMDGRVRVAVWSEENKVTGEKVVRLEPWEE